MPIPLYQQDDVERLPHVLPWPDNILNRAQTPHLRRLNLCCGLEVVYRFLVQFALHVPNAQPGYYIQVDRVVSIAVRQTQVVQKEGGVFAANEGCRPHGVIIGNVFAFPYT